MAPFKNLTDPQKLGGAIVAGVVATVVGGVLMLRVQKAFEPTQTPPVSVRQPEIAPPRADPSTAPISTFQNKFYSFSYPPKWHVEALNEETTFIYTDDQPVISYGITRDTQYPATLDGLEPVLEGMSKEFLGSHFGNDFKTLIQRRDRTTVGKWPAVAVKISMYTPVQNPGLMEFQLVAIPVAGTAYFMNMIVSMTQVSEGQTYFQTLKSNIRFREVAGQ